MAIWLCKASWKATSCISPGPKDSSAFVSTTRNFLKEVSTVLESCCFFFFLSTFQWPSRLNNFLVEILLFVGASRKFSDLSFHYENHRVLGSTLHHTAPPVLSLSRQPFEKEDSSFVAPGLSFGGRNRLVKNSE